VLAYDIRPIPTALDNSRTKKIATWPRSLLDDFSPGLWFRFLLWARPICDPKEKVWQTSGCIGTETGDLGDILVAAELRLKLCQEISSCSTVWRTWGQLLVGSHEARGAQLHMAMCLENVELLPIYSLWTLYGVAI
jgi:hypothetical protein